MLTGIYGTIYVTLLVLDGTYILEFPLFQRRQFRSRSLAAAALVSYLQKYILVSSSSIAVSIFRIRMPGPG